ncbi:MAG: replicative DNA helicase [Oscillospiraceae bacterium]|nr:replicative DNA helicase [Oscillospiraceae bacterium]
MSASDFEGLSLPCNISAEKSVLGCVFADNNRKGVLSEVISSLRAEHFYVELHSSIYSVMARLYLAGTRLDAVVILNECIKDGIFESEAEASSCAKELMDAAPSSSAISAYAKIVIEKYMLRSLILAANDIIRSAGSEADGAEKTLDLAERKIYDIRAGEEDKSLTHVSGVVFDRIKDLTELAKELAKNGGKPVLKGLETGFKDVDNKIFGLNRSELVILAARPGMGKTSFAMNIAVNVAKRYRDKSVCIFSIEMRREELVSRMISSEALLPSEAMRTGAVSNDKWTSITEAADVLSQLPIYIDDSPVCNVMSIKSKLRRMKNLGLVIIDHLGLMTSVNDHRGNKVAEVSEITRDLKVMAKELNVPVMVLSQLSRAAEKRENKSPMLSDLRDSGSIEQDADVVLFLHREAYYDQANPNKELCECNVAKNRHGETGVAKIGWKAEYTKFVNVEFKGG